MPDKVFSVLILCTGNSCRSQMAESMLRAMMPDIEVHSAGVKPAMHVSHHALTVLTEKGYNTNGLHSKGLTEFEDRHFDLVITVCDNARETCPVFPGKHTLLHHAFTDPADAVGTEEQRHIIFRHVGDEIETWLQQTVCPLIRSMLDK